MTEISIKQFINIVESLPIYYYGNDYKETLNYCRLDELNRLKRLVYKDGPAARKRECINELLYILNITNHDELKEALNGIKKINYKEA